MTEFITNFVFLYFYFYFYFSLNSPGTRIPHHCLSDRLDYDMYRVGRNPSARRPCSTYNPAPAAKGVCTRVLELEPERSGQRE